MTSEIRLVMKQKMNQERPQLLWTLQICLLLNYEPIVRICLGHVPPLDRTLDVPGDAQYRYLLLMN